METWALGWTWLGRVADVASLVAAAAAGYAAVKVRTVVRRIAFNVRVDRDLATIEAGLTDLRLLLRRDPEQGALNSHDVYLLVRQCMTRMELLERQLGGEARKEFRTCLAFYRQREDLLLRGTGNAVDYDSALAELCGNIDRFIVQAKLIVEQRRMGAAHGG